MIQVKAHAGCEGTRPNTMASLRSAMASGASILEIDVQQTADRRLVAWHDDMLAGAVIEQTPLAQLKALEPELMTLDEALDGIQAFEGIINLDLKKVDYTLLFQAACGSGLLDRIVLTGIYADELPPCRAVFGETPVWHAAPYRPEGVSEEEYEDYAALCCKEAVDAGSRDLNIWFGTCRPELVERAHALGIRVHVWTVDDEAEMREAIHMEPDSITTNRVTTLYRLMAEKGWDT